MTDNSETMSTAEPVSVTVKLHKLLSAIPKNDRGLVWQLKDRYTGDERLEVHGVVAKAFKYILDNTDELLSALSHVQEPAEVATVWKRTVKTKRGVGQTEYTDDVYLAQLWRGHPNTVTVSPLYASPTPHVDEAMVERALAVDNSGIVGYYYHAATTGEIASHVILRENTGEELWRMKTADYDRGHSAMMAEIERIKMRQRLEAAIGAKP